MLYPLSVSSHMCTDPRQLRASLSCSLCSSIPPPSRIPQPQLTQLLLHCLLPLVFRQTGIPQSIGPSEMERAAGRWQEEVLPGAAGAGMRRLVGSYAWCEALGNPWCRSGFSQEQPSSPVTAQGLGASLALAQGEGEERGAVAPAGQPWEACGEHRVGSPCALGVRASVGMYKHVCVHTYKSTLGHVCMCVNVCKCEGQRLCVRV